jgi:subtilase family protein/peptidase inhibitor I9
MGGSGLSTQRSSVRIGLLLGLMVLACGVVWFSTPAGAAPLANGSSAQGARIPNHYIVVLKHSIDHPGAVAHAQIAAHGGRLGFVYRYAPIGYSATLSKRAVEALRSDPRVRHVTPDTVGERDAQAIPNGVKRVFTLDNGSLGINEMEDITVESDIAILDSGIEAAHPDLNVVQTFSCVPAGEEKEEKAKETEEDEEVEEIEAKEEEAKCAEGGGAGNSHGTHVAGTAAAKDNTVGVVGVAPGARLWSIRVINAQNKTSQARVLAGLNLVIANAAEIEVANLSLSCRPAKEATECTWSNVETAINTAVEKGVVVVVSAGNRAKGAEKFSPAKNSNAITVGAIADFDGKKGGTAGEPPCSLTHYKSLWGTEKDDTWANLSNWGAAVDVVAPGVCILSTLLQKKYGMMTGTSMAAPAVSGAAAILAVSVDPENKADVEAIRTQIEEEGNFDWNAEKEGPQQPLLDVTNFVLPLF